MLKRKITNTLIEWKNRKDHKPLIIKGPRQCGKTFIVLEFAKKNYDNVIYLNFIENPEFKSIFNGSLEIDNLTLFISSLISSAKFESGKTILIFDEIQECPLARTSLKFFKIDGRYDVLATGSLLGVSGYKQDKASIPVGYEEIIDMYPLDFEEFLWANGIKEEIIDVLRGCLKNESVVPDALHIKFRDLLKKYAIVGGMPSVVNTYLETNNINMVVSEQKYIISSYKDDMVKYAIGKDKACIKDCFESIPKQLAKENKKFQYSVIKTKGTSSKYEGAIKWIEDVGIIKRCYNLSITELPLDGNAISDVFKVYMVDTGLFVSMLEDGTQYDILNGNLLGYNGAIYENLIADIFSKNGKKLYYFHKDSGLEIDFVMRYQNKCTLVKVKATSGNTKSTKTILAQPQRYHVYDAIKLGDYNVGRNGQLLTLPLYMAFLL